MAGWGSVEYLGAEFEAAAGRSDEAKDMLMVYAAKVRDIAEHDAKPLGHRNADAEALGYDDPPYKEAFGITFRPTGTAMAAVVYNVAYDALWIEVGEHPTGRSEGGSRSSRKHNHAGGTLALGYHILQNALDKGMVE